MPKPDPAPLGTNEGRMGGRSEAGEAKEQEILSMFRWGKSQEETNNLKLTKNLVPQKVEIIISLWDETMKIDKTFKCTIPILSYPTIKPRDEKKKKSLPGKDDKTKKKREEDKKKRIIRRGRPGEKGSEKK
jgi:hypothetical protein